MNPPRRATERDLDLLRLLEAAAFEPYRRAAPAELRSQVGNAWVLDGPGRLDGLLVLETTRSARIAKLATHPEARGQGVGRRLLAHAEATARSAGSRTLTVEAEELDPALVAWYEGLGYARVGHLPDFFHAGCSAIQLRKAL